MYQSKFILAGLALSVLLSACEKTPVEPPETVEAVEITEPNVLLAEWTGPYSGVPPFDKMELADIKPAMETAMADSLAELDVIARQAEPATFENTILAMEAAGPEWDRVSPIWGVWSANVSSPEFREIQQEMAPRIAEYYTAINQNEALFERVKAVYEGAQFQQLQPDQQRLVWLVYDGFASNGATLQGADKERFAAINQRLAELQTRFSTRVLADEEGYVLYLDEQQLGGLPDSVIAAAAQAATDRGQPGSWAITNTRSSMDPFLTYSDDRALREQVWNSYYSRGNNGDENDTNELIAEILKLRQERSELLGYGNFAEWQIQNRMAKTPEAAMDLMLAVWPAAIARVGEEVADMQAIADAEGADITIAPWDYRYYAEKVRKAKYDLDSNEVKQYLQGIRHGHPSSRRCST